MSSGPVLAPDAAMALGIATTAMPFARTPGAEVERWLRVLRLHGQVGIALQALGVSEMPLEASVSASSSIFDDDAKVDDDASPAGEAPDGRERRAFTSDAGERDAVALVTEHAVRIAGERGAPALATVDLLMAVMDVYGETFDRALELHGTDREELLDRLRRTPH